MDTAFYEVVSKGEEWFVRHDGHDAGPYVTKEAAFEAVVPPISLTIADGLAVELKIEGGPKAPETP